MSTQAKSCPFEAKLRESEKLHRLILSNLSDTVLITDETGAFTYICPNIECIFGYSSQEAQEFGNISNLLGNDFLELDAFNHAREICNLEWTIRDKAGRIHTILINVKRIQIQGGTRLYSCRDITDCKIVQEALRQSHEELGKRVQERTAQLCESNALLRESSDIACRYGGEELLLILPDASLADTQHRAEQLRQGVKQLQVEYHHQLLNRITISLGVACFPAEGFTGEAIIQAADTALYQAKKLGRDRVAVASTSALELEVN